MKKQLSLKNLLLEAWSNFVDYFAYWLMLFLTQWVIIVGFLLCSAATLALVNYFFIDMCWFNCLFKEYGKFFTVSMVSVISVFIMFFIIIFPIMYKQNALDIVLKRPMSGFDVNNRFFSYAITMFVYWMLLIPAFLCGILPGILLSQRWRFVGLHILEHGGSIRKAFRSSWKMTKGYGWFLVGVSMIQWLIFLFCGPTMLLVLVAVALNRLIDASMYKQLHVEYDKGIAVCVCEV